MTTTHPPKIALAIETAIDDAALRRLAEVRGLCLTFFLPDQKPGAPTGTHHALLRRLVREARASRPDAVQMLEPVEAFADDESLYSGGPGLAIFCSTQLVECFRAPGLEKAEFVIASHFQLTPLLTLAHAPRNFFVLAVARKNMRLFRYLHGITAEVIWPGGVPTSLFDAEGERPEVPENRSTTGMGTGTQMSVQFGASNRPDREGAGSHLNHFFRQVDAGIAPVLEGLPLMLAGVAEEVAAYRRAAKYGAIMPESIDGSLERLTLDTIAKKARSAALEAMFAKSSEALAACRAIKDPVKKSDHPKTILHAAASTGRVHKLCVREGSALLEPPLRDLDFAHRGSTEDTVNAAVAETLRTGGEVFVVRAQEMPLELTVAALRY